MLKKQVPKPNRLQDALMGAFIGEALGALTPLEQAKLKRKKALVWGIHSSLTLCLLSTMYEDYSVQSFKEALTKWQKDGFCCANQKPPVITNKGLLAGLTAIEEKGVNEQALINKDAFILGHMLPFVFWCEDLTPDGLVPYIKEIATFTHQNEATEMACLFYVLFGQALMRHASRNLAYQDAYEAMIAFYGKACVHSHFKGSDALLLSKDVPSSPPDLAPETLLYVIKLFLVTTTFDEALRVINETNNNRALLSYLVGSYYGLLKGRAGFKQKQLKQLVHRPALILFSELFQSSYETL